MGRRKRKGIRHHALMNNTQAFERLQKDIESPYEMDAVGASPHGGHYSSSPVVSSPARNYNNGYGSHGINGPGSLRSEYSLGSYVLAVINGSKISTLNQVHTTP
jgi:hypothetical protein